MKDFQQNKSRILDRLSILDVVSEHVRLQQRGRRWVGLCPFHNEKTPSFTVTPEMGIFKCFGCGRGGDIFSFVQLRDNIPFVEALAILADRAGIDLVRAEPRDPNQPDRADLFRANEWALKFFADGLMDERIGQSVRAYLRSRQINEEMWSRFELGLATAPRTRSLESHGAKAGLSRRVLLAADLLRQSDDGRCYETFRDRLMFPIRDPSNRVIGFGGRTLGDDRAKYLNTRQTALFDKGRCLYGLAQARDAIGTARRAVVVEGYTDCLAAHQAGFTETVATLGTAMTPSHVDLLRRYADEMILLFDSDDAGVAAADRAINVALPRCMQVRLARVPEGKDPADMLASHGAEAFSDVLNHATDALEFKWLQTQARFGSHESDARRRDALLEFLRVVGEATATGAIDEILRGQVAAKVAALTNLPPQTAMRLLTQQQSGRATDKTPQRPPVSRRPENAEQAGWTTLLEVILNEPERLSAVRSELDWQSITDECDRRIAAIVWELDEQGGTVGLSDVLARCHDLTVTQRVTDLAQGGSEKGNFAARFDSAIDAIRSSSTDREMRRRKELIFQAESNEADLRRHLAEFGEGVGKGHRFCSPRHRAAQALVRDGVATASQTPKSTDTESL